MMYPYSLFGSQRYYSYSRSYPNASRTQISTTSPINKSHSTLKEITVTPKEEDRSSNKKDALFEIFGITLYFDDLLLIALIFFLYNEGVQDQYLFIALVLLLLS